MMGATNSTSRSRSRSTTVPNNQHEYEQQHGISGRNSSGRSNSRRSSQVIQGASSSELRENEELSRSQSYMGTLVVVKEGIPQYDISKDPAQLRLDSIPFFHSIIIQKDKLAWTREGEGIRQKLDSGSALNICFLVQTHFRKEANSISKHQNFLTYQVKDVEHSLKKLMKGYTNRQRAFAKHAESLGRIHEFAHLLAKCQAVLNDCKRSAQLLNNLLPEAERLEPFSWADQTETELVPLNPTIKNS